MGGFAEKNGRAGSPLPTASLVETAWPMVRLGDVCAEICRVKSLSPQPDEIEYIDISSVDRVSKRVETTTRHTRETMPGRAQQLVEVGDVLISTVRPNLNAVAIVERKHNDYPLVASTGFCVVRPKNVLRSEFLYWYSQSSDFIEPLVAVSEKASYPSVTDKIVKDLTIPLPPLFVQRVIVERLETELGEAEKVAAGFRRIAENAEAEFKAELDETFKALEDDVSRGGAETRRVRLGDVCDAISCRGHQIKQTEIHAIGRFPVVSQSENQIEGYTDKDMAISDVPLIIFGDHTCIVKKVVHPFVVGADGVKLLKPKYHDIDFLFWYLKWAITALIDGEYRRHYSDLSNLQVIIPHHSVQRSIVTHLDAARERCDKIKAEAEKGLKAAENLRKAILKEAFEQ